MITLHKVGCDHTVARQSPTVKGGLMHQHGNGGLQDLAAEILALRGRETTRLVGWISDSCCGVDTVKFGGLTGRDTVH